MAAWLTFGPLLLASPAPAQVQASPRASLFGTLPAIGTEGDDRARLGHVLGADTSRLGFARYLLRSPSAQAAPLPAGRWPAWQILDPEHLVVGNSALPATGNDGPLWAGRGTNQRTRFGVRAEWRALRAIIAPELVVSQNDSFVVVDPTFWFPPLDQSFSPYASPWNVSSWYGQPLYIDLPVRLGQKRRERLTPGQSSLWVEYRGAAVGLSTENHWWGPGLQNAIVLSNNAGGFPHLFVRPARPVRTPVGVFDGRWLVGTLHESEYFDFDARNDRRSITLAALTWQPARPSGLVVGLTRAVYGPLEGQGLEVRRFFRVLEHVGHPSAVPFSDTTTKPRFDQVFSLFGRWVLPQDSTELYFEFGRTDTPVNLRDLVAEPTHSMGMTLGGQHLRRIPNTRGVVRLQAETSFLENGGSIHHRPAGSWYTSRGVRQGYTHDGQILGASIGPGASLQFVAADAMWPRWRVGAFAQRVRWNNDARQALDYPSGTGWCEFDVTLSPGVRAAASPRFGVLTMELIFGNRLNAYFQNNSGCPKGNHMRDVRNRTVKLSMSPSLRFR